MTHGIVYCLGFTPNNQMSTLFKPFPTIFGRSRPPRLNIEREYIYNT